MALEITETLGAPVNVVNEEPEKKGRKKAAKKPAPKTPQTEDDKDA